MKVLLHALGANTGGGKRHLDSFIPALARTDKLNAFKLLIRSSLQLDGNWPNVQIERIPDDHSATGASRLLEDICHLPRRVQRERFDVLVSLTNFGPVWSPAPHILFQRNALYFAPAAISKFGVLGRSDLLLRRRLAYECMKRATLIVTPSNSMAAQIRAAYPKLDATKFRTIYHGCDIAATRGPLKDELASKLVPGTVKVLCPSHGGPYKGLDFLFRVIAEASKIEPGLRLITTYSPKDNFSDADRYDRVIAELNIENNIVNLGTVPQAQMEALYRACDALIHPSLTESFGFPLVEAMHLGLPIVAADTDINREICAAAAQYYPLNGVREAARLLLNSLKPDVRAKLRSDSQLRTASIDWSWERNAREFSQLLEQARLKQIEPEPCSGACDHLLTNLRK